MENLPLNMAIAFGEGVGKESVSKFADVIGDFFPFFGLKKKSVSVYIQEIQDSGMSPEAKMMAIANTRKTFKELKNQWTIAQIAYNSAKEGTDFSEKSLINDEWLNRFMDSAKFVSSDEGQILWGHVLAGEFEKPGTFPLQVIRVLSETSSRNAKVFSNICNLLVRLIYLDVTRESTVSEDAELFLFRDIIKEYDKLFDINFESLSELQILGLIQYEPLSGFVNKIERHMEYAIKISYADNTMTIVKHPEQGLPVGCVILTETGTSIADLFEKTKVDNHFKNVVKLLKKKKIEFMEFS